MKCTQVIEIDELASGMLAPSAAAALRRHIEACHECRAELVMVTAERALFDRRAAVYAAPPPALAVAIEERLAEEIAKPKGSVITSLRHVFARGHFTAACAAAAFLVAAFSRSGGGGVTAVSAMTTTLTTSAAPVLASTSEDPDAPALCGARPAALSSSGSPSIDELACTAVDDALSRSLPPSPSPPRSPSPSLACTTSPSCEATSSVTCAGLRQ